jgi:hypothetical protein
MSSLLFIAIVGPPITEWNPLPFVKTWLAAGRHAATDAGQSQTNKNQTDVSAARVAVWKCFE